MSQPVPPASPLYQPSGTRKVGSGYPTDSTCLYLGLRGQYFEFVHGSTATGSVPQILAFVVRPFWVWGSVLRVGLTSLPIVNSHAESAAMLDSKAASWNDWAFKFESMAAAAIPSSRDTLDWADIEAGPDSVEINPQVYVALAELLEGEALDIVQNTTRGAGLEAWRKLVRRFDPQTVGRKRTLLSRIVNPGTVKVHELSRAIEQWEERVRSYQSRAREKILMTCVLES